MRFRSSASALVLALALMAGCLTGCAGAPAGQSSTPTAGAQPATSLPPSDADRKTAPLDVAASPEEASVGAPPLTAAVQAQVDYVLTYWSTYNSAYGVVAENDCVNFTSQSLLARGWSQDDKWYTDLDNVYDSAPAWVSSTAFRDYLLTRADVTALEDTQRDQVAVGDIVQFDWDDSGDRDHTGVVTKVETTPAGISISFAGHTTDSDYRDVDEAISVDHPGGTAYYFHISA